jgi:hypothetical protein
MQVPAHVLQIPHSANSSGGQRMALQPQKLLWLSKGSLFPEWYQDIRSCLDRKDVTLPVTVALGMSGWVFVFPLSTLRDSARLEGAHAGGRERARELQRKQTHQTSEFLKAKL